MGGKYKVCYDGAAYYFCRNVFAKSSSSAKLKAWKLEGFQGINKTYTKSTTVKKLTVKKLKK